jgi:hypothetical protein
VDCEHEFFVDIADDELNAIDAAQHDLQTTASKLIDHVTERLLSPICLLKAPSDEVDGHQHLLSW